MYWKIPFTIYILVECPRSAEFEFSPNFKQLSTSAQLLQFTYDEVCTRSKQDIKPTPNLFPPLLLITLVIVKHWSINTFYFILRQKADRLVPKYKRQVTTWQVSRHVERRFHSRESNCQPLPWDLGMSPLSFGSLGSSRSTSTHCQVHEEWTSRSNYGDSTDEHN